MLKALHYHHPNTEVVITHFKGFTPVKVERYNNADIDKLEQNNRIKDEKISNEKVNDT